ncbi:MAG: aminotransferase class V-fold PLP-dependent enzyme [Acidobacteria bacterium]|nr:aminotransferase class V-fold PLP-dependent enzyme [Acidobacteriota bacterium]
MKEESVFQGAVFERRKFIRSILAGGITLSLFPREAFSLQSVLRLDRKHIRREAPDGTFWSRWKKELAFEDGLILMNNGTVGPIPKPVFRRLVNYWRMQAIDPFCDFMLGAGVEEVREKVADFINASPNEVVLTRNTTEGINFVANGLPLKKGDEVLISNLEHPAGIGPWKLKEKREGIVIKVAEIGPEPKGKEEIIRAIERAITPRTKVISLSHTVYITGLITPMAEISKLAHDKGILVLADGAHGIGMLDLDMKKLGVDFYATSPYKWLGAPVGNGILYIRKEVQDRLFPTITSGDWEKRKGARRFEPQGQRAIPVKIALGDAIDFQKKIGKKRIERRIKSLATYLRLELLKIKGVKLYTSLDPELSAGLTTFSVEGVENQKIVDYLKEKYYLVIRTIGGNLKLNAVRASTHYYHTYEEVDLLLRGIRELLK